MSTCKIWGLLSQVDMSIKILLLCFAIPLYALICNCSKSPLNPSKAPLNHHEIPPFLVAIRKSPGTPVAQDMMWAQLLPPNLAGERMRPIWHRGAGDFHGDSYGDLA